MVRHRQRSLRSAGWEALTSLPRAYRRTRLLPPDDADLPTLHSVETGMVRPQDLSNVGHRILGILFWGLWIFIGNATWWYYEGSLTEAVIASAIWVATFLFVILGVPVVRTVARGRGH